MNLFSAVNWMNARTSGTDGVVNEFCRYVEVTWNVCARVIGQWEAHVANLRTIAIISMACVDLAEPCAFGRVQYVRYANLS